MESIVKVSTRQEKIADKAFERLLEVTSAINPELTDIIRAKYEDDRREFTDAARAWTPSTESSYWAKKGCKKCYGVGTLGKRHLFVPGESAKVTRDEEGNKTYQNSITTMDIQCTCAKKNYGLWLAEFRLFWNMLKEQTLKHEMRDLQEGE